MVDHGETGLVHAEVEREVAGHRTDRVGVPGVRVKAEYHLASLDALGLVGVHAHDRVS